MASPSARILSAWGCHAIALFFSIVPLDAARAGVDMWTNEGPDGADITAVAVDPDVADTVYVGTAGGGVFKSIDGGLTWSAARTGLNAAPVSEIIIDSANGQLHALWRAGDMPDELVKLIHDAGEALGAARAKR